MKLSAYFNPYPGIIANKAEGKECLLLTAITFKQLSNDVGFVTTDPEGSDSIKCFLLAKDNEGVQYTPSSLIREYSGKDRELIKWFFLEFSKGEVLKEDELSSCDDWVLENIEAPAPVLEYATRQEGVTITISDDQDWKQDFFKFVDKPFELPNIHGQDDCSRINAWIKSWSLKNVSFQSLLEERYSINFCTLFIL